MYSYIAVDRDNVTKEGCGEVESRLFDLFAAMVRGWIPRFTRVSKHHTIRTPYIRTPPVVVDDEPHTVPKT